MCKRKHNSLQGRADSPQRLCAKPMKLGIPDDRNFPDMSGIVALCQGNRENIYWIKVAFKTSGQSPGSSLEKVGISDDNCLGGDNGVSAVSGRGTDRRPYCLGACVRRTLRTQERRGPDSLEHICKDNNKEQSTRVDAFIINEITRELPTCEVDGSSLNIPNNISLADPKFCYPAKIDLLLGADIFWDLISLGQIKLGVNKPILQNSILGCHEIRRQLNKFWELEEVSSRPKMSEEEEACEQHFVRHSRLPDGRFCVTLPLKLTPAVG
ncbi:hypothetical protein EVAR_21743_1 [Eumeta japonica]|uniref:Uncharacterized protein n=1 Tax=Eumeta variegata TaxID=151549 RepID=A0A4C1ZPR6_EUMVA|nr:hypothetical protein EVAR_21743_1 [Eumeta japonica]